MIASFLVFNRVGSSKVCQFVLAMIVWCKFGDLFCFFHWGTSFVLHYCSWYLWVMVWVLDGSVCFFFFWKEQWKGFRDVTISFLVCWGFESHLHWLWMLEFWGLTSCVEDLRGFRFLMIFFYFGFGIFHGNSSCLFEVPNNFGLKIGCVNWFLLRCGLSGFSLVFCLMGWLFERFGMMICLW